MAGDAALRDAAPGSVPGRRPGALIALEGIDGCGKSTQARLLAGALTRLGADVGPPADPGGVVREPGGTPLGEDVRDLLLHRDHAVGAWAEALLYAAARAQLAEDVLRPALLAGRVVILDRFVDSSLSYQGHARGLGIDAVLRVNDVATGGLLPDLALVLDLPLRTAAARRAAAADRIEAEGDELQSRVAEGYARLAERFPLRVRVVAAGGGVAEVAEGVAAVVMPWLRRRGMLPESSQSGAS